MLVFAANEGKVRKQETIGRLAKMQHTIFGGNPLPLEFAAGDRHDAR